jgi:hypothetical protein
MATAVDSGQTATLYFDFRLESGYVAGSVSDSSVQKGFFGVDPGSEPATEITGNAVRIVDCSYQYCLSGHIDDFDTHRVLTELILNSNPNQTILLWLYWPKVRGQVCKGSLRNATTTFP